MKFVKVKDYVNGRVHEVPASRYRELAASAARGAKMLDRKRPGWWRRVRTTRLRMTDGCSCVYGQLHAEDLLYEMSAASGRGNAWFGYWPSGFASRGDWSALQEEWLRQIRDRRRAARAKAAA